MSSKGTNSILLLACRILPQIKFSWGNFLIPLFGGFFFAFLFYGINENHHDYCKNVLEAILQFDGAVLGLILAVFGIYGTVESNQRTLFAITRAPPDSKFSFYKIKLITVFKMCFWVFISSTFLLIIYSLLLVKDRLEFLTDIINEPYRYSILAFFVALAQLKILIELKVYVFSMYQRALTEARTYAIEQKQTPFDNSID